MQRMHHQIEGRGEIFVTERGGGNAAESRAGEIGDEDVDLSAFGNQGLAGAAHAQVTVVGDDLGAFRAEDLDSGRSHVVLALCDQHAFAEQALSHDESPVGANSFAH